MKVTDLKTGKRQFRLPKPSLLLGAAFAMAALFLLVGSKSSPLYPMNDNVDLNVYMTVGREMLNGKVPYRDLFEQKGPLLFMVHAFLAIFFKKSYFGVYLLETVTFGLFLYYSGRICALYVKNRLAPYLVMLFLGVALPLAPAFINTGSLEEVFLFAFPLSAFYLLRAIREDRPLTLCEDLIIGLLAGLGFWSKYTFCGFFAGLALTVIIWYGSRGWWLRILRTAGEMLAGLILISLPALLYFALHGALGDLFRVYFTENMTLYAKTEDTPAGRILSALRQTLTSNMTAYGWLFVPGALFLLAGIRRHWRESLAVLLCFAGIAVTTYISSPGYAYYGLTLAPFSLCGLTALAVLIEKLLQLAGVRIPDQPAVSRKASVLLALSSLLLAGAGMLAITFFSSSAYLMKYKKEDLPQYQFAETVRQTPGATMLNYWFLDGGFYYVCGTSPVNRFFCFFNMNPPELQPEQEAVVLNAAADYIVCRRDPLPNRLLKKGQYELVQTANFFFSYRYYDYYLYKKTGP